MLNIDLGPRVLVLSYDSDLASALNEDTTRDVFLLDFVHKFDSDDRCIYSIINKQQRTGQYGRQ